MIGYLAQVHEPKVGQAEVHIGESSPGQIDRLKAQIGNDPRCERIWCARQDNAFLLAQHHSKCLDVRSRHRFPPALWNDPGPQQIRPAFRLSGVSTEALVGEVLAATYPSSI